MQDILTSPSPSLSSHDRCVSIRCICQATSYKRELVQRFSHPLCRPRSASERPHQHFCMTSVFEHPEGAVTVSIKIAHLDTTSFNLSFASSVALGSGKPLSASMPVTHSETRVPGKRCTKLAKSSARFGMTLRGPSDPAERRMARKICGPKWVNRTEVGSSSGEGYRVATSSAIYTIPRLIILRWIGILANKWLTKKSQVDLREKRSCVLRPNVPIPIYISIRSLGKRIRTPGKRVDIYKSSVSLTSLQIGLCSPPSKI